LLESAAQGAEVLLSGREAPALWTVRLPDLASRFAALLALPLGMPDEQALCALVRKLLADRQLAVPDTVIARMLQSLERSPDAVRRFVADADEKALSEKRPFNLGLVRELLSGDSAAPP
jgi:chromosomal replication initiation ATPase DnaA